MTSTNAGESSTKLNGNQNNDQKMSNDAGDMKNHKKKDNTEVPTGESSLPRRRPGPRSSRTRSIPTPASPSKGDGVKNNTNKVEEEPAKVAVPIPASPSEKGTRQGLRSKNSAGTSTSSKNEAKNDSKSLPTIEEAEKTKKRDEVVNGESERSDKTGTEQVVIDENAVDLNAIQDSQAQKNDEDDHADKGSKNIAPRAPLESGISRDAYLPVDHQSTAAFSEGTSTSDTLASFSTYGPSPRSSINTQRGFYAESPLISTGLGMKRSAPVHSFEEMTDECVPKTKRRAIPIRPIQNSNFWSKLTYYPCKYLFASNNNPESVEEVVESTNNVTIPAYVIEPEPVVVSDEGIEEDATNSDAEEEVVEAAVQVEEDGGRPVPVEDRRLNCVVM